MKPASSSHGHNNARLSPSKRLTPPPSRPDAAPRAKQPMPAEIIGDLMQAARTFYGDAPDKWHADQHFIKRNVITWPARWLNSRAITLPPERYKTILLDIFMAIKQHGKTEAVKYWPGYLMKCVQDHFKIHGEEYYDEGKNIRLKVEAVLGSIQRVPTSDPISAIAEASRALTARKPVKKPSPKQQLNLL